MQDQDKTQAQLIAELTELRQRVGELEIAEAERKRVEAMLRESEEKYHALMNNASDAILLADAAGNLLESNKKAEELLGYTSKELRSLNVVHIHPPEEMERTRAVFRAIVQEGTGALRDGWVMRKDGQGVAVDITGSVVEYGGKQVAQGIFRDITERKRVEEALRVALTKYETLFDSFPLGITVSDQAGKILESNPMAERLLGVPYEEHIQRVIDGEEWRIVRPDGMPMPPEEYASVRALEENRLVKNVEMGIVKTHGEIIWINVTAVPLPLEGYGVVVAYGDITERKRAEEALRASEERLSLIFDTVGDVVFLLAVEPADCFRFIAVNPAFLRVTGLAREQVVGKRIEAVLPPVAHALVIGKYQQAIRENRTVRWDEVSAYPTGTLFGQVAVTPAWDTAGTCTRLIGSVHDITEIRQAEEEIRQSNRELEQRVAERTAELSRANAGLARANRLKDEFLAAMSHELRTPLNAILGMSESLQEGTYGPLNEKQLKSLRTIEASGRHLLALITDILDLSKIGAGKVELRIEPVSVESVCQASLQFVKQDAHKQHLQVSCSLDSAVTTIQADARRLKQILVNLLSNAVKFTPEGGQIGLDVIGDTERQVVRFEVWDTGIGIAPEDAQRLFQPFVQLDARLSRRYSGTGLGLALVRQLTEMHGGSVSVESEGVPGKGSRFIVSLPWQAESGTTLPGNPGAEEPHHLVSLSWGRPVKVLLAEDNESNLSLMADYLQSRDYTVVMAEDGHQAIERAKAERPDMIIMDVQMPGLDGLEAIRRIRAEADLAAVPIIAMTGLVMPGDDERCLEAGANSYLTKPISLKVMLGTMQALLKPATASK